MDDDLKIRQVTLKEANSFVSEYHRHHAPTSGHKFSIGCYKAGELCGVAMVGRPLSRYMDDGETLEVTRLCTNGEYNACSILYGRCARIAKDFGYKRIITYILKSEPGTSLKASGWICEDDDCGGGDWSKCSRREEEYEQLSFIETVKYPTEKKKRYVKHLQ